LSQIYHQDLIFSLVDKGEARKKQKLKLKEKKMAKPNAEMVYGKFISAISA